MVIYINSFPDYAISFLKESVLTSFTAQQKKIIFIASIVFGLLAAWFMVTRCIFGTKQLNVQVKNIDPDVSVANKVKKDKQGVPEVITPSHKTVQKEDFVDISKVPGLGLSPVQAVSQQVELKEHPKQLSADSEEDEYLYNFSDLFSETDIPTDTSIDKLSADSQIEKEQAALPVMFEPEILDEKQIAKEKPLDSIQSLPPLPSEDKTVIENPMAASLDEVPHTQAPPACEAAPQSPKEKMKKTFHIAWQNASQNEKVWMINLWEALFSQAEVLKWERSGESHEYFLEISKEVSGTHSKIPMGKLVVKQKMRILFTEEKILESSKHRKMISFPDHGICHRVGWGYLSKDTALERMIIEEPNNVLCTVKAMGYEFAESPEYLLNFIKTVQWQA